MDTPTIIALSTPPGIGAIGVIRLSGNDAIMLVNQAFKGKDLEKQPSHTVHFGTIRASEHIIDEVVVTIFKGPNSFTKEDVVEISCHGSNYIIQSILKLFIGAGAILAKPGEFTQRAFINGRFDLAQAEAVADLIAAESEAAHSAAMKQMRGGFSGEIQQLREELIHFASMIELELDFSEEDVEFASRVELSELVNRILKTINGLIRSFELGNALKKGVPVVIAGKPNAGKSTLLNALLNEDKAIVSDIPGTTRDTVEDTINIEGVLFRFIDTAGLRETSDKIESIGVQKTREKMRQAAVIILLIDLSADEESSIRSQIEEVSGLGIPFFVIGNKSDLSPRNLSSIHEDSMVISAKDKINLELVREKLVNHTSFGEITTESTVVTSVRHLECLTNTKGALQRVLAGVESEITNDFLAMDIRQALFHLGEITGEITTDDLLANIFSKFCIGK